jgi:protein SCO1/2
VLTDDGTISRILYGIEFKPDIFKMALLESSQGKVGTFIDRVLMYCYHYDPQHRKYSLKVMKVMQAGGGLVFLFLVLLLGPVWIKNYRKQKFQGDI